MATWDPPSDAELDVDKPIKAVDIRRIRDLSEAMAEGAPGAPTAGGLIPISSIDLASDATADFTGFDAAKYGSYVFDLANVIPVDSSVYLSIRLSIDGGSTYKSGASDYAWSNNITLDAADTRINLMGISGGGNLLGSASTDHGYSGLVSVHGPHLTKHTFCTYNGAFANASSTVSNSAGGGRLEFTSAVDAVRFIMSTGSLESGTITMYGVIAA